MPGTCELGLNDPMLRIDSSLMSPDITVSNSKISCVKGAFVAHMLFAWFIFLTGIGCFVTRVVPPKYKWLHAWLGRGYIISMLWCTATSLLINNTGLPGPTIFGLSFSLVGLCVAWMVILYHNYDMSNKAHVLATEKIVAKGFVAKDDNIINIINESKMEIANSKSFLQRFVSWKSLHGIVMFMSWFQIAGRIFAAPPFLGNSSFACYTYPAYKPIATANHIGDGSNITLVPSIDPDYSRLPWAWSEAGWNVTLLMAPILIAAAIGAGYTYYVVRHKVSNGK